MILAFELTWTGTAHAPGNGATLQTIAAAFPGQTLRVFAEDGHIAELAANRALASLPTVSFAAVTVSSHHRWQTNRVSLRRLRTEFATIRRALAGVPAGEPCLLIMLSATSTAVFAACAAARLRRGRTGVQIGLHGNAHEFVGWRSRNPLRRWLDLASTLDSPVTAQARFLVLETAIRDELARRQPRAAARTDVLPLPINADEIEALGDTIALAPPVCFGFVGQATEAKGIDIFLRVAAAARARFGGRVAFVVIGRAPPGSDLARFADLAAPVGPEHLSRAEFVARLARVHYVLLPFQPGYYDLATSGALIDAVTWLRPVIAMPTGFVDSLFSAYGDVGEICADEAAITDAVTAVAASPDPARYERQRAALRRAREDRRPEALAACYRAVVTAGFPGLFAPVAGTDSRAGGPD